MLKQFFCTAFIAFIFLPSATFAQIENYDAYSRVKANTVEGLAEALTADFSTDKEKVLSLYYWIAQNIKYDIGMYKNPSKQQWDAKKILKARKTDQYGYAILLHELCQAAGLKSALVHGYFKDWKWDDGDTLYNSNKVWNAVYAGNKWQLIDMYSSTGYLYKTRTFSEKIQQAFNRKKIIPRTKLAYKQELNEEYLFPDPKKFRKQYLSEDPMWQLADSVMPMRVFETGEQAVDNFNAATTNAIDITSMMNSMATVSESDAVIESERRILKFNPRNNSAFVDRYMRLATKRIGEEVKEKKPNLSVADVDDATMYVGKAKEHLTMAFKNETDCFRLHNQKNKLKKDSLNNFCKQQNSINKAMTNKINKLVNAHKQTNLKGKKSYNSLVVKTNNAIQTSNRSLKMPISTVAGYNKSAYNDSVKQRTARTKAALQASKDCIAAATQLQTKCDDLHDYMDMYQGNVIDDLKKWMGQRAAKDDSYDKNVQELESTIASVKRNKVDSCQQAMLGLHDSIALLLKANRVQLAAAHTLQSTMLRDAGSHRKKTGNDEEIAVQIDEMKSLLADYLNNENDYVNFLNTQKRNIETSSKHYATQKKIFDLVKKIEQQRYEETKALLKSEQTSLKAVASSNKKAIASYKRFLKIAKKWATKQEREQQG